MATDLEMGNNPMDGGDQYSPIPMREQRVCGALLTSDWTAIEAAITDFGGKNEVYALRLNQEGLTPLLAAMSNTNTQADFIMKLIENMPPELLQLTDYRGNTALHLWDRRQNNQTEKHVAELLLQKCGLMRYFQNVDRDIPQLEGVHIITQSTPSTLAIDEPPKEWERVRDAIEKGSWSTIKNLFGENKTKFAMRLGTLSMTPLHYAIKKDRHVSLVNKMIDMIPKELLALTDVNGTSVLHLMANKRDRRYGELAKNIVHKNPIVLCFVNNNMDSAIQAAIDARNRPMVEALLTVSMEVKIEMQRNPVDDGAKGYKIYKDLLAAEFYDLAERLLDFNNQIVLGFNCLDRLLKSYLSYELHSSHFNSPPLNVYTKSFRESARTEEEARLLVVRICRIVTDHRGKDTNVGEAFRQAFLLAARNGLTDTVLEILKIYGPALEFVDDDGHSAFQLAVMYRYPEVFNALYNVARSLGKYKILKALLRLEERNTGKNILHLAADKPCREQYVDLKRSGPILQMQSEVRWFKELEKFLPIDERMKQNKEGKTPIDCFQENHQGMVTKEIEWVTSMATACTTAATLIATVAFASAVQIPGGTAGDDGHAAYGKKTTFSLFGAANALALFFSAASVLSFLSVFTSRFDAEDFLSDLPSRLIHGIIALFVSVISLMIAFAFSLFLVFAKENPTFLGPLIVFAAVPVILYAFRQMPPLLNIWRTTYKGFRLGPN